MKKNQKWPPKRSLLLAIAILLIFIIGFFVLGGTQKVRQIYYRQIVRKAHKEEFSKLTAQLELVGINNIKKFTSKCSVEEIALYPTKQLLCVSKQHEYVEIGTDRNNKEKFINAAKQLDTYFKENGWTISSNATPTFTKYISGITSGIDYYPGIGAHKIRKNAVCGIDMGVAYSNPKPPAVAITLTCNSPLIGSLYDYVILDVE